MDYVDTITVLLNSAIADELMDRISCLAQSLTGTWGVAVPSDGGTFLLAPPFGGLFE